LKLGSINPTYFLKGSHKGSLSSNDESIRKRYIEQTILSAEFAEKYGSGVLAIWLPDGSNYPGQVELKSAIENTEQSFNEISVKIGNQINGIEVVEPAWLEQSGDKPFVLNYVTNHGARDIARTYLQRIGYVMGEDYLEVG